MATEQARSAIEKTNESTRHLLLGLKYIPDDKLDWVPMGKAKTPLAIIAECAAVYQWLAAELSGQQDPDIYERVVSRQYAGRDQVEALLREAQTELEAAMETLTEEELPEVRDVFWGPTTVADLLWAGKTHSDYHSGQLNYIQTLVGDAEMHME